MTIGIVKCIVFAIAVSILYGVIGHLNRKRTSVSGKMQSDAQYVVTLPSALKYVYMAMFLLGIALFFIFLAFTVSGNESVTMGHLYFALVFATIGLLVMLWVSRWSVVVTGASMEIHGLLHKKPMWGDRIFEKCGIGRDEGGDGGKTLEIRGKRRLSARDGGANYQQS